MRQPQYIAIDLKSFYASVECRERGLDPMTTNLVVADAEPHGKDHLPGGVPLPEGLRHARAAPAVRGGAKGPGGQRQRRLARRPDGGFTGASWDDQELRPSPGLAVDYLVAPPQMAHYMDRTAPRSTNVYLKYIAPEDIHVYSIDEVFMDATAYLDTYGLTARELAVQHDPGRAAHHRDHRHGGHRHQPVSVQGGHGHRGQASARRTRTACASRSWTR